MKIHMACGRHVLDGYVNVDMARHPSAKRDPELLGVDVKSLPIDDGVADEILAIHVFEHLCRWEVDPLLQEWARVMKSGGVLVLEMPDIIKCARNVIANVDDLRNGLLGIYGATDEKDPLMYHRWGWTFCTIKPLLEAAGFHRIKEKKPQWHGVRLNRDFRVECVKC